MKIPRVLGVSGSLRNARRGLGNQNLIDELSSISNSEDLKSFLHQEALSHLDNFKNAGRDSKESFDTIYKNLKKLKGNKGLSNSEVALSAALWSAKDLGCDIDHLSLAEYFKEGDEVRNIEELDQKLLSADAIILSTPVYFGDRGSLSQSLIYYLRRNKKLLKQLEGKVYAGVAVGAKRNGGQETTLVYQLLDMIQLGFYGVGNDSETTSQYGGTGLAGDIGTMSKDDYGLATAMGTGRRVARVSMMLARGESVKLTDKPKIAFWLLQDYNDVAKQSILDLCDEAKHELDAEIIDFTEKHVIRCLACDICPTHIDVDSEYRCIIKNKKDDLMKVHEDLLNFDAIIPVVYSSENKRDQESNYQRLIERTRYLRRGDYVLSDSLTAPLVIEDIGHSENMTIRMMTSMIRHHTVLGKPMTLYRKNGKQINLSETINDFKWFVERTKQIAASKIDTYAENVNHLKYNPVGYVLSTAKDEEDEKLMKRNEMIKERVDQAKRDREERLSE